MQSKYKAIALVTLFSLSAPAMAKSTVVRPGDSLSSIAKRELGSGKLWPQLCELNKAILPDCENLPVGVTILLAPEAVAPVAEPTAPEAETKPPEPAIELAAPPAEPVPIEAEALPVEEARTNLVADASDFTTPYWSGYFVKPTIEDGKADPGGGEDAAQLAAADYSNGGYSGVYHPETVAPGTYTVGVWLRSVSGEQSFRYGVSDPYLAPEPAKVGEEWQYFQAVIEVDKETNRLFQVYESQPGNAAWEIYGVSVEKGAFTTPFFPGK